MTQRDGNSQDSNTSQKTFFGKSKKQGKEAGTNLFLLTQSRNMIQQIS